MKRLILVASVVIPMTLIGLLISNNDRAKADIREVRNASSHQASSSMARATGTLTLTEQICLPFAHRNSPPVAHVPEGEYLFVEDWTNRVLGAKCARLCIDFPSYSFYPSNGELVVYLPGSGLVLDEGDIGYIGSGESLSGMGSGAVGHLTKIQSLPSSIDGITLHHVDETGTITLEHESKVIVLEAGEVWVVGEETEAWDWLGVGCIVTSTQHITNYAFQDRDRIIYVWPFRVLLPVVARDEL